MSNEAEVNMAFYINLRASEEKTLKEIESDVVDLMFKKGITARLIWTSRTDANGRFIQLCMYDNPQPKVLFELEEGGFANLSKEELVTRLHNGSMGQSQ